MIKRLMVLAAAVLALAGCSLFHMGRDEAPAYIVFFRYDSTTLTPDARKIVDQAAFAVRDTRPRIVQVAGYTPETAAPASRLLAVPRFMAVENALIADGVDPRSIQRVPLPESETVLSATADRRIEIRLVNKAGM